LFLLLSFSDRLGLFGWREPESPGVILLNAIAITTFVIGWILTKKGRRLGLLIALLLSGFRIAADAAIASLFFAFIVAYIPTGPFPWHFIIQLSTPLYLTISVVSIALETYFFVLVFKKLKSAAKG
jgi:hypothetical protein